MKKLLIKLMRRLGMFHKAPVYNQVDWASDDRVILRNFLLSETGKKLLAVFTNAQAIKNAEACVAGVTSRDWAAGVGFGVMHAANLILMLQAPINQEAKSFEEYSDEEIDEALKQMTTQGGRRFKT